MKIIIIASAEKRQRYKFISVPLLSGGHDVNVIQMRPSGQYLVKIFKSTLIEEPPELVISVGIGPKALVMFFLCQLKRISIVVRLGGDPVVDRVKKASSSLKQGRYLSLLMHKMNEYLARIFLRRFDGVIVVNGVLARNLADQVKNTSHLFIVPQYCEGEVVPHNYSIGNTVELLTVANLGFSEKAEGVIWIITQLINFSHHIEKKINYRVAGGGDHLADIKKFLATCDLPDNLTVSLDGFVDGLDEWYQRADIFLYHSTHDAVPNVILETKKYGIPLMANDCEEFREIVCHSVSGLLYRDETDFMEQLMALEDNESMRKRIGHCAQEEHKNKYSVQAIKKALEENLLQSFTN